MQSLKEINAYIRKYWNARVARTCVVIVEPLEAELRCHVGKPVITVAPWNSVNALSFLPIKTCSRRSKQSLMKPLIVRKEVKNTAIGACKH
jgi:hypothetical protein